MVHILLNFRQKFGILVKRRIYIFVIATIEAIHCYVFHLIHLKKYAPRMSLNSGRDHEIDPYCTDFHVFTDDFGVVEKLATSVLEGHQNRCEPIRIRSIHGRVFRQFRVSVLTHDLNIYFREAVLRAQGRRAEESPGSDAGDAGVLGGAPGDDLCVGERRGFDRTPRVHGMWMVVREKYLYFRVSKLRTSIFSSPGDLSKVGVRYGGILISFSPNNWKCIVSYRNSFISLSIVCWGNLEH